MTDQFDPPPSDSGLGQTIEALRRPVSLGNGPLDRAMAVLAADPRRARSRAPLWIGAGFAAALGLWLAIPGYFGARPTRAGREIQFLLTAPAHQVMLIGDFNDWDRNATPLVNRSGVWSTTMALKPGRYRYAFVVDGSRLEADPAAPPAIDEFGTSTSAITVGR
ncbi:MAG: isoamylase early set domain-containing protein [Gemmatimonadota bacterium]